jgi:hypothetical protein
MSHSLKEYRMRQARAPDCFSVQPRLTDRGCFGGIAQCQGRCVC